MNKQIVVRFDLTTRLFDVAHDRGYKADAVVFSALMSLVGAAGDRVGAEFVADCRISDECTSAFNWAAYENEQEILPQDRAGLTEFLSGVSLNALDMHDFDHLSEFFGYSSCGSICVWAEEGFDTEEALLDAFGLN